MPRVVAVAGFPLPLSFAPFGFFFGFFGFDFLAELFVFGVFGFAAFAFVAFVIGFFGRDRSVFALIVRFAIGFVFFGGGEQRHRRGGGQARGVRRGGRGEQQQRGEQEDQQDREFPHGSLIGARGKSV